MSFRETLIRIGPWPRRAAAVVCLLLAAVTAIDDAQGHATTPPNLARVVVAVRTLPAAHLLRAGDLRVVRMSAVPGSAASPDALAGRLLAGPIARGEPVTRLRLIGRQLVTGLPSGLVAIPVVVADDVRGLVEAGSHVDVISVTGQDAAETTDPTARRLLTHALVLAVTVVPDSTDTATRLVLAVDRDTAVRVTAERATRTFHVVANTP